MSTDAALDRALALARASLAATPAGLLSDLDGTLAPIVRDPAAVRLADGAAAALAALAARLAVVGVVTGRTAADARRLVGTSALLVIGNHGAEWLEPGQAAPQATLEVADAAERLDAVLAALEPEPGVTVEHKGLSATVHYRRAADPAAARARIVAALEGAPRDGVGLRHGRMSVELRLAGLGDKGTALRRVVERYALRGLVVLGDDVTDLDMFRAAAGLRVRGRLRAAIIAVDSGREVPPQVIAAADVALPDQTAAVRLLEALT